MELSAFLESIGNVKLNFRDILNLAYGCKYHTLKLPKENNNKKCNISKASSDNSQKTANIGKNQKAHSIGTRWTEEEINALVDGITTYGIGMWEAIAKYNKHIFSKNRRSAQDIARKWRDLKKNPKYNFLLRYYI